MSTENVEEHIGELADFLKKDRSEIRTEMELELKHPGVHVRNAWRRSKPRTRQQVDSFYRKSKAYLFDLAAEHTKPARETMREFVALALRRSGAHSVLDFGGGAGYDLEQIARLGCECTYYDLPGVLSEFALWRFHRLGLNVRVCTALSELGQYDAIICLEVLEHVRDPIGTLRRFYEKLNDGGVLLVTHAFNLISDAYPTHLPGNRRYAKTFERYCREIGFNPILMIGILEDKHMYVLGKMRESTSQLSASRLAFDFIAEGDPLTVLLSLYHSRKDLQSSFGEVERGDYRGLLSWAVDVGQSDPSKAILQPHVEWYKKRLGELTEVERVRGGLSASPENAQRMRSEVERLRVDLDMSTATLGHIENSPAWRLIGRYRILTNRYLPFGTKRRAVFEWIVRQVLGPIVQPRPSRAYRSEQLSLAPTKGAEADDSTPFGKWLGKTHLLMATNPRHLAPTRSACIDIVIPIHNALESLQECLRSIRERTMAPYRVVLVNDASTDPRVAEFLARLQHEDDLVILTNSENMGFVRSANRGCALSSSDVVLLNSDTIVTNNWLDKLHMCAYSSDAIGTVTPLSNNATLCSVPKPWQRNEVPRGFTVDTFGTLIENVSQREYPPIPTAVGFCVYIKRRVLEGIGDLDSNAFSPAYGEENDFCMRAFNKGFLSVLDDSTFVYHKGEMSFGASASSIRESHLRTLHKRYPDYPAIVAEFTARNPLRVIQARIKNALAEAYEMSTPKVLHVIHLQPETEASGGTGKHCRMLYNNLDDFLSYVMYPQDSTLVLEDHTPVGRRSSHYSSGPQAGGLIEDAQTQYAFSKLLREVKPDIVHFQHLLGMPLSLVKTAKEEAASVVVTCHDGYLLCRDYRLLEMGQTYCDGCTDMSRCDKCLAFQFDLKPGFQERWREACRSALGLADRIVVPSEFMKELFSRVLSIDKRRFTVIEHALPTGKVMPTSRRVGENGATRVGFVGAVCEKTKGLEVVLGLLSQNKHDDVEWHFFGERSDIRGQLRNRGLRPRGSLVFHGYYHEGELPSLLSGHNVDVVVIPSIYAESYSYVLTEVWQAGVPVIAADFGAIGERVGKNGGGWLYPPGSEPESILSMLEKLRKDRKEYDTKSLEAKSVKSKSYLEYVNEYRVLYRGFVTRNLQQLDLSSGQLRFRGIETITGA
jgi:GT2 family glycosyltransferase/2-polyprenyl-3-methyl-5-hydroxy-6-metoxy-1,4-benzoquinol methylase